MRHRYNDEIRVRYDAEIRDRHDAEIRDRHDNEIRRKSGFINLKSGFERKPKTYDNQSKANAGHRSAYTEKGDRYNNKSVFEAGKSKRGSSKFGAMTAAKSTRVMKEDDTVYSCKTCKLRFTGRLKYLYHTASILHANNSTENCTDFSMEESSENFPFANDMLCNTVKIERSENGDEAAASPQIFICHMCVVKCNSEVSFAEHVAGTKHVINSDIEPKTAETEISTGGQASSLIVESETGDQFTVSQDTHFCRICDVTCKSEISFAEHTRGLKHATKVEAATGVKLERMIPKMNLSAAEVNSTRYVSKIEEILQNIKMFPVIGADYIVEYKNLNSDKLTECYCHLCASRCHVQNVAAHIVGQRHRAKFLHEHKEAYPVEYPHVSSKPEKQTFLENKARDVEKLIGRGHVTVTADENPASFNLERKKMEINMRLTRSRKTPKYISGSQTEYNAVPKGHPKRGNSGFAFDNYGPEPKKLKGSYPEDTNVPHRPAFDGRKPLHQGKESFRQARDAHLTSLDAETRADFLAFQKHRRGKGVSTNPTITPELETLVDSLTCSMIHNEEEELVALRISNALTQAIVAYKLRSDLAKKTDTTIPKLTPRTKGKATPTIGITSSYTGTSSAPSTTTGSNSASPTFTGSMGAPSTFTGQNSAPPKFTGSMGAPSTFTGPNSAPPKFTGSMGAPSTFTGPNSAPYTFTGTNNAPSTFTGSMGAPSPFTRPIGAPSPFTGSMGAPSPFTESMGAPSTFTGPIGAPLPYIGPNATSSSTGLHGYQFPSVPALPSKGPNVLPLLCDNSWNPPLPREAPLKPPLP